MFWQGESAKALSCKNFSFLSFFVSNPKERKKRHWWKSGVLSLIHFTFQFLQWEIFSAVQTSGTAKNLHFIHLTTKKRQDSCALISTSASWALLLTEEMAISCDVKKKKLQENHLQKAPRITLTHLPHEVPTTVLLLFNSSKTHKRARKHVGKMTAGKHNAPSP